MDDASNAENNFPAGYRPAEVWHWERENGGRFANVNRPIAGATHEQALPVGQHPIQLYSMGTPNGVKITLMLEELLVLGHPAEYDAWLIDITEGDQFGSGFVGINPNSKIPAMTMRRNKQTLTLFESGSILLQLAEHFDALLPTSAEARSEALNWLFWQVGSAPYLGGGFGHFYSYAPIKIEYCIDRFSMEVKRQLDVLDKHLASNDFMAGTEYSIADIAIWAWYGALALGHLYNAADFLEVQGYTHLQRWAKQIAARPAVKRGVIVNKVWGEAAGQLRERHSAADIDAVLARLS